MRKKERFMRVFCVIRLFFINGVRTLRLASKGRYYIESEDIESIREELFSQPEGRMGDVKNMNHDRQMVERDTRSSFNKIVLAHG